jgi:hypothetical protein
VKIVGIFIIVLIINTSILESKIDLENKIKLSEKVLLQFPRSFCVTEDKLVLVVDFKAGDVKIYNGGGELVKILGKKGYGPNEFAKPYHCYYTNRKFIISDTGQRRIFIYDRKDKFNFVRTKEILPPSIGLQFYLKNNMLYITGHTYDKDNNPYEFYMIDLEKNNHYTYFLPGHLKFGLNSGKDYNTQLLRKPELSAIGTRSQFDIHDNFAYYFWEGDLKIFKINLETKEIKTFGEKGPDYIKPYASKKLIDAFKTRQFALISKERKKMNYVKNIFTTQKHVLLIYEVHEKNHDDPGYMIQFYTLDGNFVKEQRIPGEVSWVMFFDKQKNFLYAMEFKEDENFNYTHYIVSFKISE